MFVAIFRPLALLTLILGLHLKETNIASAEILRSEIKVAQESVGCTCQQNNNKALNCSVPFQDIGGHCLFIDTLNEGTWADVRLFCQNLGGQLVKIDSADFHYDIIQFIRQSGLSPHWYWIGGSDIELEGQFVWLDGSPVKLGSPFWHYYYDILVQQPNGGNCVALEPYFYEFCDISCEDIFNYICEKV